MAPSLSDVRACVDFFAGSSRLLPRFVADFVVRCFAFMGILFEGFLAVCGAVRAGLSA